MISILHHVKLRLEHLVVKFLVHGKLLQILEYHSKLWLHPAAQVADPALAGLPPHRPIAEAAAKTSAGVTMRLECETA